MIRCRERVALVTGASGGLGAAIASKLGAQGLFVLLHYRSNPDTIAAMADKIEATGGRCAHSVDSSVWFYRGLLDETGGKTFPGKVTVPTAVADFPRDLINGRPPQSLIQYGYNLVRYRKMPRGGHFAAFEQPELFSSDVADFFHSLDKGTSR